jgi:hypothetical protein
MSTSQVSPRPTIAGLLRRGLLATPERFFVHHLLDRLERRFESRALGGVVPPDGFVRIATHLRAATRLDLKDPERASSENAQLVLAACDAAGVEPFLVTDTPGGGSRFGLRDGQWSAVVACLRRGADPTTYVEYRAGLKPRIELLARVSDAELRGTVSLSVFRYRHDPGSGLTIGVEAACRLDRWQREDGRLRSATHNLKATDIPADTPTLRVPFAGRQMPTYGPFTEPDFDAITFPIDAVYLWVDGGDPAWQRRRQSRLQGGGEVHELAIAPSRFRDYGELRYSLRSLRRYAPWVRHLYLVTDRQRPDWLVDSHPGLTVVDHRDIFSDPAWLPTFNSHAISTQLHHIEGLSEHYVVLNDDVLLTRPFSPGLLFDGNGVAKFSLSRATVPAGPIRPDELPHDAARKRARDLVADRYGRTVSRAFLHTPIPQLRSWQFELEARYAEEYARTAAAPFRSASDTEVVSWLHHYAGYYEGRTRPARIPYDYFHLADRSGLDRMERVLRDTRAVSVCLNDGDDGDAPLAERSDRIRRFLDTVYPEKSDLERSPG